MIWFRARRITCCILTAGGVRQDSAVHRAGGCVAKQLAQRATKHQLAGLVRAAFLLAKPATSSRAKGHGPRVYHFGDLGCGIRIRAARAGKQIQFWGQGEADQAAERKL
jgi:hypothetical protein